MKKYNRNDIGGMPCITLTNGRRFDAVFDAACRILRYRGELTAPQKKLVRAIRAQAAEMDSLPLVYAGCYNHVVNWFPGFLEEE